MERWRQLFLGGYFKCPPRQNRRRPRLQPIRDLLRRRFDQRFQTARGQDRDRFLIDALAVGLARREVGGTGTIYKRHYHDRRAGEAVAEAAMQQLVGVALDRQPYVVARLPRS